MKELSLLIDESGDFGETRDVRDYYLVTFVFHDQSKNISAEIQKLEESMRLLKHSIEYIHHCHLHAPRANTRTDPEKKQ